MNHRTDIRPWNDVLDFWFPESRLVEVDVQTHHDHWSWRMRGGADAQIIARFADVTTCAATGTLDQWASDAEGRLALIIVLDQFSRSLWRGTPRAFAQDPTALSLMMEGLSNGHFASLAKPWLKIVHGLPLGHCEGADHLKRLDLLVTLREEIAAQAPPPIQPIYQSLVKQAGDVRKTAVAAFS